VEEDMPNRGVLIERHSVQAMRVHYTIIFKDEAYIHGIHTRPKNWTDDGDSGFLMPTSKGIVRAGGIAGFVLNTCLI
jgi:hypothetical protein